MLLVRRPAADSTMSMNFCRLALALRAFSSAAASSFASRAYRLALTILKGSIFFLLVLCMGFTARADARIAVVECVAVRGLLFCGVAACRSPSHRFLPSNALIALFAAEFVDLSITATLPSRGCHTCALSLFFS